MDRLTAGEMKNQIRFEKVSRLPNQMGGYVPTWSLLCTIWGKYRQLSGKELLLQQQVNPLITVEIITRYRTDISTDNRAFYNNKYHNIISVIDEENTRVWLKIMCEVKQSDQ